MQTVILAGGLATRLHPVTRTIPKSMVEVAGKPFLEHQLELLHRHRYCRVVICAGHMADSIEAYFGDGSQFGMRIQYSHDGGAAQGTGGALFRATEYLDEEFFVLNGDSYLLLPYPRIAEAFRRSGKLGMMVVYRNENRFDRSNVEVGNGLVRSYEPRNNSSRTLSLIDAGLIAFKKEAILNPSTNRPYDLGDLLSRLATEQRLAAFETFQRFYEIGSHAGLTELRGLLGEHPEGSD